MADADKDFPYRIAYDEAVRALSQQQSMIDSLRTLHMHDSYADNLAGQKQLASRFRLAGVLLTLEVIFWIIDLASKT